MNRQTSFLHLLFLVGIFGFVSSGVAQDAAVPVVSKLRAANELIEDIYGQQLQAAQTGPQKSELAEAMQRDAAESKENLAQFYALLDTAIELASQAGDSRLAISLVEELDGKFELDRNGLMIDVLSDCVSQARGADREQVALDLANLLNQAMQSDDVEYMKQLASLGSKVASRAKNRELAQQFKDAKKKISKLAKQNKEFESAIATLAKNPADVKANQIAGQHYCFVDSQWSKGLEHLAKVDGASIQSIAKAELKKPTSAQEQLELARTWASYADQSKDYQGPIRLRARHWYALSVAKLEGIKKRQAQAELDKLELFGEQEQRLGKMEKYLISGSDDNTIRVWDLKSGVEKLVIDEVRLDTRAIGMSPRGKFFASGSADRIARIWNLDTGKLKFTMTAQQGDIKAVDFSPDGKWLASGDSRGWIYIWDAKTGTEKTRIDLKYGSVWGLDWKPDGSQIAVATSGAVFLIDAATGTSRRINARTSSVRTVRYSPDGTRLVSGGYDKTVKMWNPDTAQAVGTITAAHARTINSIDFSPDGKLMVTGSDDYKVRVWTHAGKPVQELTGHKYNVVAVRFSPSGRMIASSSLDNKIILWDAKTGEQLKTFDKHTRDVWGLDFGF